MGLMCVELVFRRGGLAYQISWLKIGLVRYSLHIRTKSFYVNIIVADIWNRSNSRSR